MQPETLHTATDPVTLIEKHVRDVISGRPLYLVEVIVRGRRGSQVVEVFVDSDTGVDLDTLAHISRELGYLLDLDDVIKGKYRLNVSSPGVERPLKLPRQYKKNGGRKLHVRLVQPTEEGEEKLEGVLLAADDEAITLRMKRGTERVVAYHAIAEARVLLPW